MRDTSPDDGRSISRNVASLSLAMRQYSTEPKTRKYVKGYEFLSFARKYGKQLLDTTSKKVIHKAAEAAGEF